MSHTLLQKPQHYFLLCFLLAALLPAKAQNTVSIPDTAFVSWLNNHGFSACMSGNQLDTTCSAVLNATSLTLEYVPIKNLDGVQYFKNVTDLECDNDNLDSIPALPPALVTFNCVENYLTFLGALPQSITTMYCGSNNFITLPALPASLQMLDCSLDMELVSLPTLPSGLQTLITDNDNALATIPNLSASLQYFSCEGNFSLVTIPAFGNSLQTFICDYSALSALPALPNSLIYLDCSVSGLTSLPVLPPNLKTLNCYEDNLGQSGLPALPASLQYLYCGATSITSLGALPNSLLYLDCNNLQLAGNVLPALPDSLQTLICYICFIYPTLPPLPNSLTYLDCDGNVLNWLPALPAGLQFLDCGGNGVTSISQFPSTLTHIDCNSNLFTSFPDLPDNLAYFDCSSNSALTCLPQLKRIDTLIFNNTAVTCLPDYGSVGRSTPALNSLPLCGIFSAAGCNPFWTISGKTYYDVDNNCSFDTLDVPQGNVKMFLDSSGVLLQQVYTGGEGYYSFLTNHGTYTLFPDTSNLPFTLECPGSGYFTDVISTADSLAYDNNFAFKCRTSGFDIGVISILNTSNIPRPGAIYVVNTLAGDMSQLYGASCASGISGQLQITYSGPVTYLNPAPGALTPAVSGNTLTYTIPDFGAINSYTAFNTVYQVNSNAISGSAVCLSVSVTPSAGDYNLSNNTGAYCFSIVNSLDPNEKEVYPTSVDSAGQWLTYTVRFQNTGNAPAVNVIVKDTLDANLDPSTFQLLTYSAPNTTQVFGNAVIFNFPNINLPDSLTSDSLSRGYVQFRVKTISNLSPGAVISNTASIYFDLNPAVVTNTVTDTVASQTNCTPNGSSTSQSICSGDSVLFNGAYYDSSGAYNDTLTNIGGCDSIVTLNLTINIPDTINIAHSICAGDSFYFGGNYLDTSGTYYSQVGPCDSLIILSLTVLDSVPATAIYDTVCFPDSVFFNGLYINASGIYIENLPSVNGCDSMITLYLTVNTRDTFTVYNNICTGDSFYFYGTYYAQNVSFDTLVPGGCDTLYHFQLVVETVPPTLVYDTICSTDSILFNGSYYNTAGNYPAHFSSINGCDSLVTLNLSITNEFYDTVTAAICAGDTFYVGHIPHTAQGNYSDTLQSEGGCDSVVALALTVHPLPVVTLSWDSLVAEGSFNPFGFFNSDTMWCAAIDPSVILLAGGSPLGGIYSGIGVSANIFHPDSAILSSPFYDLDTITYSYTDVYGCASKASDTVYIYICESVPQIISDNAISIYPNPANSLIYIKTEGISPETITIYDVDGQQVASMRYTPEIDIHNLTPGVYLLEVNSAEGVARKRWVKM